MSLVNISEVINNYIENILGKEKLNDNDIKLTKEYNKIIELIFETNFQCLTKKYLIQNIENDYPKHFELAKSTEMENVTNKEGDTWIFGYGSLIWKADFPFEICRRGYICGYERRFYQNSLDHRGTPERPGRVVTCIPSTNGSRVYGMAYKIKPDVKTEVLSHLDYREKNGYERCTLDFFHYPNSNLENFKVIMYIATADNTSYAGDISGTKDIVKQIYWSWGPSGSNREYIYNLYAAMKNLFPDVEDSHLFEITDELRKKESADDEITKKLNIKLREKLCEVIRTQNKNESPASNIEKLIDDLKQELYNNS